MRKVLLVIVDVLLLLGAEILFGRPLPPLPFPRTLAARMRSERTLRSSVTWQKQALYGEIVEAGEDQSPHLPQGSAAFCPMAILSSMSAGWRKRSSALSICQMAANAWSIAASVLGSYMSNRRFGEVTRLPPCVCRRERDLSLSATSARGVHLTDGTLPYAPHATIIRRRGWNYFEKTRSVALLVLERVRMLGTLRRRVTRSANARSSSEPFTSSAPMTTSCRTKSSKRSAASASLNVKSCSIAPSAQPRVRNGTKCARQNFDTRRQKVWWRWLRSDLFVCLA